MEGADCDFSHEHGLKIFADVFGCDSVSMLTRSGIDGFKIHGTDMRNTRLLKYVADIDLPCLLSIGGGTIEETKKALSIINRKGRKHPVVLMHGFQSYPTLVEHTHLKKMCYFKDQLGLPVGFADHIEGDHRLNFGLCAAAIGMGAVVIEKHITISRTLKMEDYESALTPDDFIQFVDKIRGLELAMGNYSGDLNDAEKKYRTGTRKHVVGLLSVKAGQSIKEKDVTLRCANAERDQSDLEEVIGKKADRDYEINDVIIAEDLIWHLVRIDIQPNYRKQHK